MTNPAPDAATVIKNPDSVPGGYLVIISVDAIREKTERSWGTKQDAVWEFAQRRFEKTFPRTDAILKLSDVDYMVAQVSEEGVAAQFKAIDLLKSILVFFLGSSNISQIKLSIVRSMADGFVEAEALSQHQIEALMEGGPGLAQVAPALAQEQRLPPKQLSFTIRGARTYDIVVSIEPIWNVYKQAVASYHTRTSIYEVEAAIPAANLDDISIRDAWAIDVAVMKAAAAMIREGLKNGAVFALHVPVNFRCLRSASCRAEMARLLPLFEDIRKGLAFCIVGVPDGAPAGALAEAISVLRPAGIGVVMQPASMNKEVMRWRNLGLSAVSYDFLDEVQVGPEILKRTQEFGAACAGVVTALVGLGIATRPLLMGAWGAGFTHISGTPITEKMPEERTAVRFPAEQIYT